MSKYYRIDGQCGSMTCCPRPADDLMKCGLEYDTNNRALLPTGVINSVLTSQIPWQVAIYKPNNGFMDFEAFGSLIHPRIVLTAAHNIHNQG